MVSERLTHGVVQIPVGGVAGYALTAIINDVSFLWEYRIKAVGSSIALLLKVTFDI